MSQSLKAHSSATGSPRALAARANAPQSPARRRLLFNLPGGLALASPLAMWGCGGGGGGGDAEPDVALDDPAVTARVAELNAKVAPSQRGVQRVSVQLPAGAAASLSGARLMTLHNQAEVGADGTSAAVLLGGGGQMAYVTDSTDALLLLGIVDPGVCEVVDARSTAEALILVASDVTIHTPALVLALRKTLRTHSMVEPVRLAVEAALKKGPLSDTDTDLIQAVDAALRLLRPSRSAAKGGPPGDAGRLRPMGVKVWEAGGGHSAGTAKSGVWIEPTAEYNTVQAGNRFRRRAHVWIDQLSVRGADGQTVDAPKRLTDFALNPTTALSLDSLAIAVADTYAKFGAYIGFIDPYEADPTVWTPVTSSPVELPVADQPAVASIYTVRVVGPGRDSSSSLLPAEEQKLQELLLTTLVEDLYTPFMKNIVAPWLTDLVVTKNPVQFEAMSKELLAWFISDLTSSTVGRQFFPNTWAALRRGDLSGAAVMLGSEFFNSSTFQVLLHRSLAAAHHATFKPAPMATGEGKHIQVNLNPGKPIPAAAFSKAMTKFARIVNVIKSAATVGDFGAMAKDWRASSTLETMFVEATRAKLKLTPNPLLVPDDNGARAEITAALEGLDAALAPQHVFIQWTCTGKNGYLIKVGGNNEVNEFESTLLQATHHYFLSGTADPDISETVKATAYYRNPTTNDRVELSSMEVPVRIKKAFTLAISPRGGTDLPVDAPMPVAAIIQEVLPQGTTVDWRWTHVGVGSVTAEPADNVPSDSRVTFNTGASDGTATLTVQATVNVPAANGVPARTVETDPVRATFNVKKGLTRVVLEVNGGSFACGDPKACGVSEYSAYLIPRLPKAQRYSAVLSGFAYAGCNRTATWDDGQTVRDGGDCSFPVSFHPHTSAGPTNTYALWMGFGGWAPAGGKCVVTITLKP